VVRVVDMGVYSEQVAVRDPHILLATTGQLPSTARLAMELRSAGATVSLIAPSRHPARALDLISHRAIYRASAPQQPSCALERNTAPVGQGVDRTINISCRKFCHSDVPRGVTGARRERGC
jgi:hypothetical protein